MPEPAACCEKSDYLGIWISGYLEIPVTLQNIDWGNRDYALFPNPSLLPTPDAPQE